MFTSIASGSGIAIDNGQVYMPYIARTDNPDAGKVRFNSEKQKFEVFDGSCRWHTIYAPPTTIDLSEDVKALLEWTRTQRDRQLKVEQLASTNASINDAMHNLKMAQEKLDILVASCNNNNS